MLTHNVLLVGLNNGLNFLTFEGKVLRSVYTNRRSKSKHYNYNEWSVTTGAMLKFYVLFTRNDAENQKNPARYYFNIVSMVMVTLIGRICAKPI